MIRIQNNVKALNNLIHSNESYVLCKEWTAIYRKLYQINSINFSFLENHETYFCNTIHNIISVDVDYE